MFSNKPVQRIWVLFLYKYYFNFPLLHALQLTYIYGNVTDFLKSWQCRNVTWSNLFWTVTEKKRKKLRNGGVDGNSSSYLRNILFHWFYVSVPERWTTNSKPDLWRCWHVSMYSRKHTWNYLCKCWTEDCGWVRLFALYSSFICRHCLVTKYCADEGMNPPWI